MESPSANPFTGKTSCCFTGHRPNGLPAPGSDALHTLKQRLLIAVRDASDGGVTTFWAGGAQGFDQLAAEAVLLLKERRPEARLCLALPARDQADHWGREAKNRYDAVLRSADSVHYAAAHTDTAALFARNRYLVEHADCMIAYLTRPSGGTLYTVRYAAERGLYVKNLGNTE